MIAKRLMATLVATVVFVVAPFILCFMFLALHTLERIELIASISPLIFVAFMVIFFFKFSLFFGVRCFSKEGITKNGGWVWVFILVVTIAIIKLLMNNVVSKSGYFKIHKLDNPELPGSPSPYYFSASNEDVCFTLKSSGKRAAKVLSRSCYERSLENMEGR